MSRTNKAFNHAVAITAIVLFFLLGSRVSTKLSAHNAQLDAANNVDK